jgi:hypothetical protein
MDITPARSAGGVKINPSNDLAVSPSPTARWEKVPEGRMRAAWRSRAEGSARCARSPHPPAGTFSQLRWEKGIGAGPFPSPTARWEKVPEGRMRARRASGAEGAPYSRTATLFSLQ